MPLAGLIPLNTTVELLVKGPYNGSVGRVVGHKIVDLKPLNVVHVSHDEGVHHFELDGSELDHAAYNADLWKKHCWTPPT
jgi:hypothetical protein